MKSLLVASLAMMMAASTMVSARSIGTLLERDYTVYKTLPKTASEALSMGWKPYTSDCVAGLGVAYTQGGKTPDERQPLWLYFTPAGQASGAAVLFYDHVEKQQPNLINKGFIVPYPGKSDLYYVSVGFRSNTASCASTNSSEPLGDRLVVHPQGIAHDLPLTPSDAASRGWVRGSCFQGMGTHWFRDLSSFGSLTWEASQLLPVVTMYDEESENPTNSINAFFFASTVVQQSLVPPEANQWEPVALPDFLMCKNLCNSSCTFHGTDFYSTLHIYMNDRSRVTCKDNCKIACCDSNKKEQYSSLLSKP